jgi:hypothetical protein
MQIVEHTPGPWTLDTKFPDELWLAEVIGPDGSHVVCFGDDYDEGGSFGWPKNPSRKNGYAEAKATATANAHLIAAAPDLLEQAEKLVNHAVQDGGADPRVSRSDLKYLRAAIAKAKGETAEPA